MVADYLKRRGSPSHVVRSGLGGLVRSWERTVEDLQRGSGWEMDEWLNDLDVRTLIHEVSQALPGELALGLMRRLSMADLRFEAGTLEAAGCVWGEENAHENHWTRGVHWWLWRLPRGADSVDPRD